MGKREIQRGEKYPSSSIDYRMGFLVSRTTAPEVKIHTHVKANTPFCWCEHPEQWTLDAAYRCAIFSERACRTHRRARFRSFRVAFTRVR